MRRAMIALILLAGCADLRGPLSDTPVRRPETQRYSETHGYLADSGNDMASFVWQGTAPGRSERPYVSHGHGTFNLNPVGGMDGVYIGSQTLGDGFRSVASASVVTNAARSVLRSTSRYIWDGDVCWRRGALPEGFIFFEAVTNIDVTAEGNEAALEEIERRMGR